MVQRKSDARTDRTPKALRVKFIDMLIRFADALGIYQPPRIALIIQYPHRSALWLGHTYLAGEMENRVIDRHIRLELIDNGLLLVGRSLASDLD